MPQESATSKRKLRPVTLRRRSSAVRHLIFALVQGVRIKHSQNACCNQQLEEFSKVRLSSLRTLRRHTVLISTQTLALAKGVPRSAIFEPKLGSEKKLSRYHLELKNASTRMTELEEDLAQSQIEIASAEQKAHAFQIRSKNEIEALTKRITEKDDEIKRTTATNEALLQELKLHTSISDRDEGLFQKLVTIRLRIHSLIFSFPDRSASFHTVSTARHGSVTSRPRDHEITLLCPYPNFESRSRWSSY